MIELDLATQFKSDLKRIKKQQKNIDLMDKIIDMLLQERKLPDKYKDHSLTGNWRGYRECHITPDWLLIYKYTKDNRIKLLRLARTGSHSELFN